MQYSNLGGGYHGALQFFAKFIFFLFVLARPRTTNPGVVETIERQKNAVHCGPQQGKFTQQSLVFVLSFVRLIGYTAGKQLPMAPSKNHLPIKNDRCSENSKIVYKRLSLLLQSRG